MDDLTNAAKATILREFYAREAELRPDGVSHEWRWTEGVILFPEAICPLCQAPMRSNRIWLVDEASQQLLGQRKLENGRLVNESPRHPHVNGTHVCTGSGFNADGQYHATTVTTALFLAMNLADSYWGKTLRGGGVSPEIPPWLEDFFDHLCGHPEHTTAPEQCGCERHRIERGELVRCETCRQLYDKAVGHTVHRQPNESCGCACSCIPTSYAAGCDCGHPQCWCTAYQLTQPCSHPAHTYCASRGCEQQWFYCATCDWYYIEEHDHARYDECLECENYFEYTPDSAHDRRDRPYGGYYCERCDTYTCYDCLVGHGTHNCGGDEVDDIDVDS